jgi:hypothetical protein
MVEGKAADGAQTSRYTGCIMRKALITEQKLAPSF